MMLGGEFRCWLGAVQNKARADLIYRKSLLEKTEMPKAQLRPSGGSPPASSGEETRGSRAGGRQASQLPKGVGGRGSGLAAEVQPDLTTRDSLGWSDRPLSQGPGTLPGVPRALRYTGYQMHSMIDKKGHHLFSKTNTEMSYNTNITWYMFSLAKIRDFKEMSSLASLGPAGNTDDSLAQGESSVGIAWALGVPRHGFEL